MSNTYLQIRNLSMVLQTTGERVLREVSLDLKTGEVLGLVGASGAGKSMIGKAILGILPPVMQVVQGSITLAGQDLLSLPLQARKALLSRHVSLIPQDPMTALNPVRRIGSQMTGRLVYQLGWDKKRAQTQSLKLLESVHIHEPQRVMRQYPHELSGGMRQRVLIAAAFAAEPKLIIADEPTTALDVTVQKQILRLIVEMQTEHNTALLFITHDLGVVSKISQQVSVLYAGQVLEQTTTASLISTPKHAYTQALLAATPRHDDPTATIQPVSAKLLQQLKTQIAATDHAWEANHG